MKSIIGLISLISLIGCTYSNKDNCADNRGKYPWDNDPNYPNPNTLTEETIYTILEKNLPLQILNKNGNIDSIVYKNIISYNDTTYTDTIFAKVLTRGYTNTFNNNTLSKEFFERIENFKVYKVNDIWVMKKTK